MPIDIVYCLSRYYLLKQVSILFKKFISTENVSNLCVIWDLWKDNLDEWQDKINNYHNFKSMRENMFKKDSFDTVIRRCFKKYQFDNNFCKELILNSCENNWIMLKKSRSLNSFFVRVYRDVAHRVWWWVFT